MARPPVPGTVYRRPGPYRDMGGTTPVQYDPDSGVIIGDTPPGFIPPGFEQDPDDPTKMRTPGAPGGTEGARRLPYPAVPPGRSVPVPGLRPGQLPPPPGSVPFPGGGYGTPGTPGSSGDARGVGRTRGTPGTGPHQMPSDPNWQPDLSTLDPNRPGNFWPGFVDNLPRPPFIPEKPFIEDYIRNYDPDGPFINPEQLFDYKTPTAEDIPGFSIFDIPGAKAKGADIIEDRINDSIWRNRIDPYIDDLIMTGMGDLLHGMTPPVYTPPGPPTFFNPNPQGTRSGIPPILDPRNYPSGGGGFPSLGDIGDLIGDQFRPMPTPGAPYPPAPPMPRNIPPMGGGARGPMPGQFPGQMPGQFPGQMPGGFQPTMQQRPMFP